MVALLDVNVLVALAWPNHVHHEASRRWFLTNQRHGWATCPLTETAFVRVSSNPAAIPTAVSPGEATAMLGALTSLAHHAFWPDDLRFGDARYYALGQVGGFRQVMDAHLLALAIRHEGRLVSFDAGLALVRPPSAPARALVLVKST